MKPIALLALLTTGALVSTGHAGGFSVAEQSASAGGTAGAGTARERDPSGAWYNPAALVDGEGLRFGAGLIAAAARLQARADDDSWRANNTNGVATLPTLHLSWSEKSAGAGVSVGVPFGAGIAWEDGWPGRHEITGSRIAVLRIAPYIGWRFGKVRVAGGVHVDAAEMRLSRSLDFVDAEGDVDLSLRGRGLGVHAAMFAPLRETSDDRLTAGLAYKGRTTMALRGEADFSSPDAFSVKTADQKASSSLELPDRLSAGLAYERGPITVLVDADLTFWQVRERVVIDFDNEETPDVVQEANWHNTVSLRSGAEWRHQKWTGRGGIYVDPSPASGNKLTPSSPDSTRTGVTLGLGRDLDTAWAIDGFYGFMYLRRREAANPDSMPASYGGSAHMVGLGVRYAQ